MSDDETPDLPATDPARDSLEPPLGVSRLGGLMSLPTSWEAVGMAFQKELEAEGGQRWLTSRCPKIATLLESENSVTAESLPELLRSQTRAFWTGAESRLTECARCPKDGAACAGTVDRTFEEGVVVKLRVLGEVAQAGLGACERYGEYRMARRMGKMGVDQRLVRVSRARLKKPEYIVLAFDAFLAEGTPREPPRGGKVQLCIEGEFAREYGVALLRSVAERYPNPPLKSVHAPSLARETRNAMTTKEESPLTLLLGVSVLLIDAVNQEVLGDTWFRKELIWLYERRRDQGLATIITSALRIGEVFPGASVLKV